MEGEQIRMEIGDKPGQQITDLVPENVEIINKMVMKEWWRIKKSEPIDDTTARAKACENVGANLIPPVSGNAVNLFVGQHNIRFAHKAIAKQGTKKRVTPKEKNAPAFRRYRDTVDAAGYIPRDYIAAGLLGVESGTPGYYRKIMTTEGYVFKKNENGFHVTQPDLKAAAKKAEQERLAAQAIADRKAAEDAAKQAEIQRIKENLANLQAQITAATDQLRAATS